MLSVMLWISAVFESDVPSFCCLFNSVHAVHRHQMLNGMASGREQTYLIFQQFLGSRWKTMNFVKEKATLTLAEHCSMHPENSEQEPENACGDCTAMGVGIVVAKHYRYIFWHFSIDLAL